MLTEGAQIRSFLRLKFYIAGPGWVWFTLDSCFGINISSRSCKKGNRVKDAGERELELKHRIHEHLHEARPDAVNLSAIPPHNAAILITTNRQTPARGNPACNNTAPLYLYHHHRLP